MEEYDSSANTSRSSSFVAAARDDESGSASAVDGPTTSAEGTDEPKSRFLIYQQSRRRYKNTYRLEPTALFSSSAAASIIDGVLSEALANEKYSPAKSAKMATELADIIRKRLRKLERYKLVCVVHIGQRKEQGLCVGSRCIWNANFDDYASASFKNSSLFAVGIVYAVYFE